ncbi:MAG: short-chain fatty acid transporter [Acidobacteria bacterium]|nr:short-chain fatty acid transporter [Acidobacteriota bacterium]
MRIQWLTEKALYLTRRYMPAPYLFALMLTFLSAILALVVTRTPPAKVVAFWYGGIWEILAFTAQMVLMLMCGHALVDAPVVKRALDWFSSLPKNERQAGVLIFLGSWAAALFNWGFCLVVAGVLVREMPKRLPTVSKGYLAAAGYTGFAVWASGLSSSIALVSATPGSPLNIIEQLAHRTIPLKDTLWTPYNIFGVVGMGVLIPILFWRIHLPVESDASRNSDEVALAGQGRATLATGSAALTATSHAPVIVAVATEVQAGVTTPAERIEQSWWITALLAVMAVGYIYSKVHTGTFSMDLNMMIFFLLVIGWILHGTPIRYMRAFHEAGKAAGPLMLAYPMYGGILGLIRDTGLADWFAQLFVSFSTAYTLPFWSYVSSNVITLFVPSGGGHWAVQGPIMVKAALALDASLPKTAMAVAFGEQTANLVQPFWALPIVSIGGLSIREMMGYCLLALGIAFPLFGIALLVF